MLRIIQSQFNIRAPLLSACLNALTAVLEGADQLLLKKITYGLGGVAPLMQVTRRYKSTPQCVVCDTAMLTPVFTPPSRRCSHRGRRPSHRSSST